MVSATPLEDFSLASKLLFWRNCLITDVGNWPQQSKTSFPKPTNLVWAANEVQQQGQRNPVAPHTFPHSQETPAKFLKGIRVCWSKKVTQSIAQLTCLYTNAHRMGNKQEVLKITVQLASCDLITIIEMWWNKSHDWSTTINGYKMFRMDPTHRGLPSV